MALDANGNPIVEMGVTTPPAGGSDTAAAPAPGAGSPPAGDDDTSADDDTPKKGGVEKRIGELTAGKRAAERDAAYWRGVAEGRSSTVPVAQKGAGDDPLDQELDPTDFDSDSEYLKARADQAEKRLERKFESRIKTSEESGVQQVIAKSVAESRKKYVDFDAVARNPSVPVTREMFNAAVGDNLGEILYHLGSNPDEASRISSLPVLQQIKEIGKIEDRLVANPASPNPKPTPNPPRVLGGGGGSPPAKPESKMTRAELHQKWAEDRRKRLGAR